MPRVCWAPKIVSSLPHCIGRRPNLTALLGRCFTGVPAYLDHTRTVRPLPVDPHPPLLCYCAAHQMSPLRCYNLESNVVGLGYIIEADHRT